jgi:hypothetical protein
MFFTKRKEKAFYDSAAGASAFVRDKMTRMAQHARIKSVLDIPLYYTM